MSHGGLGTCKVVSHVEKGCDACPYRNRVDTHSSEFRDAPWSDQYWAGVRPGWRSGYPLIQVQTCPWSDQEWCKLSDKDGGVDTHLSESRDAPWSDQSYEGSDQDGGVDTHSSKFRHASGATSTMQGSDQDGGVGNHSSKSRHASGVTSSGVRCQTRMEEWTPTCLSPEMPPGPTSPIQGSDQDGGVDTHSSES